MNHKPMLAVDCGGIETVRFPVIASPKLDGIRAIISKDGVLSRSLKPIPNRRVPELLKGLPVGTDGELLAGDPTAPDVYRKTNSMVMSEDKPIDGLRYWVFDIQREGPFTERHTLLTGASGVCHCGQSIDNHNPWMFGHSAVEMFYEPLDREHPAVTLVPQCHVMDLESLNGLEEEWVKEGYEGVIIRKPDGPYKHGRSTLKEGYLLKLKRFLDSEAEVIGVVELMHNANEAKTNELGRTARSHAKAGKVPMGVMGALQVRDVKTGVEFEIGTGFTAAERAEIWQEVKRHSLPPITPGVATTEGVLDFPLVKYKYFPVGVKDKPRHPVFLGWRDSRDV